MAIPAPAPELRVYLLVRDLQRQFAAYLGTPTRARGYPPVQGEHSLIVEVAPALAIERVTDLALRAVPAVEPGILFVERQFGVLELHSYDLDELKCAGKAVLAGIGCKASDQLKPRVLFSDIIENITDQHAVIINRNRQASMIMPGETLLVVEMVPALFAAVAANEAEKAARENTLVDVQMIGAAGRLYIAGKTGRSLAATANLKRICELHLGGRYAIEVIDLLEEPQLAVADQILAIPTLVRKLPTPIRKIIGDLSNVDRVLLGLDIVTLDEGLG